MALYIWVSEFDPKILKVTSRSTTSAITMRRSGSVGNARRCMTVSPTWRCTSAIALDHLYLRMQRPIQLQGRLPCSPEMLLCDLLGEPVALLSDHLGVLAINPMTLKQQHWSSQSKWGSANQILLYMMLDDPDFLRAVPMGLRKMVNSPVPWACYPRSWTMVGELRYSCLGLLSVPQCQPLGTL